jgi:regulator of protease activity HflC (stomatin/prohibitin superfamily)
MTGMTVVTGLFLAVSGGVLAMAVRIVPQGEEWIVQRLGKYRDTLLPGLRFVIPLVDQVAFKVPTRDITLEVQEQEVITRDSALILVSAVAQANVSDSVRAVYDVEDYAEALRNMMLTSLRASIGEMDLDQALASRAKIGMRVKGGIADQALNYGLTIKTLEIQDIRPSEAMQRAMEAQASAERERKAMVMRAEGEKEAVILGADARLESARRDAGAQIILAEAAAQAIAKVTRAYGGNEMPMLYLLGEKYIASIDKLAASENAKVILLPADFQSALKGLLQRSGEL